MKNILSHVELGVPGKHLLKVPEPAVVHHPGRVTQIYSQLAIFNETSEREESERSVDKNLCD
jgi:hypothetical protein